MTDITILSSEIDIPNYDVPLVDKSYTCDIDENLMEELAKDNKMVWRDTRMERIDNIKYK